MSSDDFAKYLERRMDHVEARKLKITAYEKADRAQLNSDQLALLENSAEVEGSRKELDVVKEQYVRYLAKRVNESNERALKAFEEGKAAGEMAFAKKLQLVSQFLRVVSDIYKYNQCLEKSRFNNAAYQLLEQFYSGGNAGGEAIASFLKGKDGVIGTSGVNFEELKRAVEANAEKSENVTQKTELSAEPPTPTSKQNPSSTPTRTPSASVSAGSSPAAVPNTNVTASTATQDTPQSSTGAKHQHSNGGESRSSSYHGNAQGNPQHSQRVSPPSEQKTDDDDFQVVGASSRTKKQSIGKKRQGRGRPAEK